MRYLRPLALSLLLLAPVSVHAQSGTGTGDAPQVTTARAQDPAYLHWREKVAAADMRLASQWIAYTYQIPARVPQEMLLAGHDYGDTLVAMALIGEGASLNEVLEQRNRNRWPQVAVNVDIDPGELPEPIQDVMTFGRNEGPPEVLHFLPDVRPGLANRLRLPAFSPTIPDPVAVERFGLSDDDIENIRRVLDDPNDVPEEWLLEDAGPSLIVADWLIAATISKFKPFPLETLLETRVGEVIEWGDVASMFSFDPRVLTDGPLAAVYPVLTGVPEDTVLAAYRLLKFPQRLPLHYDLERLVPSEKLALRPLLSYTYGETPAERTLLENSGLEMDMAESAIALSLARMSRLDLATILERRKAGDSWSGIIRRFAIDMTGQEDVLAAIQVREQR